MLGNHEVLGYSREEATTMVVIVIESMKVP